MSGHQIVRDIARASQATIDRLGACGVATVHEAQGRRGLLDPGIRPIQQGAAIAGSAVTVSAQAGDNLMLHAAVEMIRPGDILVVTTTSRSTDGMFGELLATSLHTVGCIGLIIDAGVRDVRELNEMGFPVWARAVHAQGTVKATPGSVNIPVVCAGTAITPGDAIIADDDGVVSVPRGEADTTLDAALTRTGREAEVRDRLAAGELGLDIYGLRERLRDLGVQYVDTPDDAT